MNAGSAEECLSALFVDFDNVYLSLRRKNEEAAGRFARNPGAWMSRIASGGLVRFKYRNNVRRRFPVARCYGNPGRTRISRGGPHDPHSFATVRTFFMMAGLEVIDCLPLSSQFKNGTDIRIACDIRDYLEHPTRFGEFIILSGDADFTPVLHHLREHDRRTVVYANESTADIYKAFSDGWIDEEELISFLLEEATPMLTSERPRGRRELSYDGPRLGAVDDFMPAYGARSEPSAYAHASLPPAQQEPSARRRVTSATVNSAVASLIEDFQSIGAEILNLVMEVVRASDKPVPIAYLADRAQKMLGHAKTIGTNWAGSGGFLNFLNNTLPEPLKLSDKPPHFVYDLTRHRLEERAAPGAPQPGAQNPALAQRQPDASASKYAELQNSITRIYEASKAPPLPPSEYQVLFTLIATEVHENGFSALKTGQAVLDRAAKQGVRLAIKDVAFVLDAIDEVDPWLEHSRSPSAVARAYRDFVFAKCQAAGLDLTEDELQLIQVWFGATPLTGMPQVSAPAGTGDPQGRAHLGRDGRHGHEQDLPPPDGYRNEPPGDYGYDPEGEADGQRGLASQRLSFLKH